MSSVDFDFLCNINLNELDQPHKLCQWISLLPQYKNLYIPRAQNIHYNDSAICDKLSLLIYQQQFTGKFFAYNFNQQDFNDMMGIIIDINDDKYQYKWIWEIIQISLNNNNNNNNQLLWMNSNWDKYQLFKQHHEVELPEYKETNKNDRNTASKLLKSKSRKTVNIKKTKKIVALQPVSSYSRKKSSKIYPLTPKLLSQSNTSVATFNNDTSNVNGRARASSTPPIHFKYNINDDQQNTAKLRKQLLTLSKNELYKKCKANKIPSNRRKSIMVNALVSKLLDSPRSKKKRKTITFKKS